MGNVTRFLVSVTLCELAGLAATPVTVNAIPTWYAALAKPPLTPPGWVFGPVWTLLYLLMGISLYIAWSAGLRQKRVARAIPYFLIQLALNFFWSILFFGLRSPILGVLDIAMLWTAIAATIIRFYAVKPIAAYLLVPYLLWVTFASYLTVAIAILNR